jgi:hypothetical protein
MTQKWNLQDIRPAEPRRRRPSPAVDVSSERRMSEPTAREEAGTDYEEAGTIVIKNGNKARGINFIAVIAVVLLIIGGVFGLSALMSKTTLTIYPEFNEPTVNAEFIAYPERREGQLSYEIMTLTEEGEKQVKATGKEEVEEQAKGFLEIVKSTPGAERLIKNTRFRAPSGLIFRIQESVVVPGAIKDASGKLVPGTIRAEVFADNSGPEYNLPAGTRFDVPGFEESKLPELYSAIYAENKEQITGGFKGPRFIIDENELSTGKQALQMDLRNKLLARIQAERPADFVAFPGAVAITYNSLPTIQYGDDLVTIREQAVLQLPLFKLADFAGYVAQETIPTYMREPVRITNIDDLTFSYVYASTSASTIANAPALNFTIIGKPQIVWQFDAEQLRTDLAGKSLTAISTVLTNHTGIRSADISGKPFWKRSFPENKDDIAIIEVISQEKSAKN